MKALIYILFFQSAILCNAQIHLNIKDDKNYQSANRNFCDSLNISEPDFSEIELEFRIWNESWTTGNHQLILLQKTYDGKWKGQSYGFYFRNSEHFGFKNIKKGEVAFKSSWGESWNTILKNNYLNIKPQKLLHTKYNKKLKEILVVADGVGYYFDIVTKKAKRNFFYGNPKSNYQHLLENHIQAKEYLQVLDLIQIVEAEFDLRN